MGHDGFSNEPIPWMRKQGLKFKRIERNGYLLNTIKNAVVHIVGVNILWKTFKKARKNM